MIVSLLWIERKATGLLISFRLVTSRKDVYILEEYDQYRFELDKVLHFVLELFLGLKSAVVELNSSIDADQVQFAAKDGELCKEKRNG